MPPFLLIIEYLFLQVAAQSVLTRRRAKTAVDFLYSAFLCSLRNFHGKWRGVAIYYPTIQPLNYLSFLINTDLELWKFHLDHEKARNWLKPLITTYYRNDWISASWTLNHWFFFMDIERTQNQKWGWNKWLNK